MESEDSCCICLESFENDSEKIMLSCNHVLHSDCLYNYMLNNYNTKTTFNTCPLCRKYISTNIQKNYIFNNNKRLSLDSTYIIGFIVACLTNKLLGKFI